MPLKWDEETELALRPHTEEPKQVDLSTPRVQWWIFLGIIAVVVAILIFT